MEIRPESSTTSSKAISLMVLKEKANEKH